MAQSVRMAVLDQAPVPEGTKPAGALANSVDLAQHVEQLGYTRYWMSEHHAMQTLACTAPEVMLARIGAATSRIRLGSGGVMLPHYASLKVAEQFQTLAALYPGRIDLGLGRAPGGGPVESMALRRERRVQPADDFADQLTELLAFLGTGQAFQAGHPFSRVHVMPETAVAPDVWLLGSSLWGAHAAAGFGLPYAFAHFFSPLPTRQAIETYHREFRASDNGRQEPEAMVAVGAICADTTDEAEFLAASVRLLQARIRLGDRRPVAEPKAALAELRAMGEMMPPIEEGEFPRYYVGTPDVVAEQLHTMARSLKIREVVVNSICWDHAARKRSYSLLAQAAGLVPESTAAEVVALAG